ncbi:hypothetical protein [Xylophilus sp. ASV27]|uniref:hypothetical protein n=1 Tax=Xylophilus sp. ASV27 TaxID=2795129 RepID=UPI0018EC4354|nr:hypothetical protein [Xylophilus sp. ASV27]
MSFRQTLIKKMVNFVAGWNSDIHAIFESYFISNYIKSNPMADGMDWQERAREIDKARSFYYTRMSTTSNLLVAGGGTRGGGGNAFCRRHPDAYQRLGSHRSGLTTFRMSHPVEMIDAWW